MKRIEPQQLEDRFNVLENELTGSEIEEFSGSEIFIKPEREKIINEVKRFKNELLSLHGHALKIKKESEDGMVEVSEEEEGILVYVIEESRKYIEKLQEIEDLFFEQIKKWKGNVDAFFNDKKTLKFVDPPGRLHSGKVGQGGSSAWGKNRIKQGRPFIKKY